MLVQLSFYNPKSYQPDIALSRKAALMCTEQRKPHLCHNGLVEGKRVTEITLDTGCSQKWSISPLCKEPSSLWKMQSLFDSQEGERGQVSKT